MTKQKPIVATDETLKSVIYDEIARLGYLADLNHIDVSQVTDMYGLFGDGRKYGGYYTAPFNGDISRWDVSSVTDMSYMFVDAPFNGDISKWDVSNVAEMRGLFSCGEFNRDISNWDVGSVTDMYHMFFHSHFNRNISRWDIRNVTNMYEMFAGSDFMLGGNIATWGVDPEKVNTDGMFKGTSLANTSIAYSLKC